MVDRNLIIQFLRLTSSDRFRPRIVSTKAGRSEWQSVEATTNREGGAGELEIATQNAVDQELPRSGICVSRVAVCKRKCSIVPV